MYVALRRRRLLADEYDQRTRKTPKHNNSIDASQHKASRPTFEYSYLIHIHIIVIASLEFILVTVIQLRYPRTKARRRPSLQLGLPCAALRIVLAADTLLAQPLTKTRLARSQKLSTTLRKPHPHRHYTQTHIFQAKEHPLLLRIIQTGTVTACTTHCVAGYLLQGQPPSIGSNSSPFEIAGERRVQLAIAGPRFPHGTTAIKPSSCPRCVTSRQSPSSKDPSQFLFEPSP